MRTAPRPVLTILLLVLALGLTGLVQGMARARPLVRPVLTAMVICGEGGARVILVDAAGQPATGDEGCADTHCADCLPLIAATASLPGQRAGRLRPRRSTRPCQPRPAAPAPRPMAQPRAPPAEGPLT